MVLNALALEFVIDLDDAIATPFEVESDFLSLASWIWDPYEGRLLRAQSLKLGLPKCVLVALRSIVAVMLICAFYIVTFTALI